MSGIKTHTVLMERDSEGVFFRLPEGWSIDPIGAEVCIESRDEDGSYLFRPIVGEDGQPTSRFTFGTEANS